MFQFVSWSTVEHLLAVGRRRRTERARRAAAGATRRVAGLERRQAEHRHVHARAVGEERDALHHVRQLADVAGPGVLEQRRPGVGAERAPRDPVVRAGLTQEVLGQADDVRPARPQRGQRDRHDGQAVVEVLAEPALPGGRDQLHARGRDHPDVDRLAAGAAEPADRLVLDDLEELRLEPVGQEPDLVEEDRAAVGDLEESGLGVTGVGERPALEPEELGLQQRLGDRGAVEIDERPVRARAGAMKGAGQEPLARPGLALDQDRGRRRDSAGRRRSRRSFSRIETISAL